MAQEKRILNVGLACLDIVMVCKSYPEEDSDHRCASCRWQRGGNASNNCTVMAELGVSCEYFGTLSTDHGGRFIQQDFKDSGIKYENSIFHASCECPTSVVLINSLNGSRTIVHSNKNLPEITLQDFQKLDLSSYRWIHFEVRPNVEEFKKIIDWIRDYNSRSTATPIKISIELEKPRKSYMELLSYGDVVFISKDLAMACGYATMNKAVDELKNHLKPGCTLICPWGEDGACAKAADGAIVNWPAFSPPLVVDTLAAGDVFVAVAVINLADGHSISKAVEDGCKLAGLKCGMEGIRGLKSFYTTHS